MSVTARPKREANARRSLIIVLSLATFLFWASLYVFVPILPVYAESLGASLSMVGLIGASYAIAQLALRIPLGIWADRLGRRKPFVIGGFLFAALGGLCLALAPDPWFLFIGRTVTGIAAAAWVAFSILFASAFPPERTARAMGIVMFVNGAAQVVASLVGGYTAQLFGWQATFWVGMSLALVALPLLFLAPEHRAASLHPPSYQDIWKVATVPLLIAVSILGALGQFAAWTNVSFAPVYGDRIGASKGELGVMLMLVFGSASVASLLGIYMAERLGLMKVQALGFVVMAVGCVAVPFTHSVLLLGVTQLVGGVGRGLFFPAQMTLSVQQIAPEHRAIAMGVFQAVYAVGMLLGPLLSGIIADALGIASMFYVAAAISALCAFVSTLPWLARMASSRKAVA